MSREEYEILKKAIENFSNQLDELTNKFLKEHEENGMDESTLAFLLINEAKIQLSFVNPDYFECLGMLTDMINRDFEKIHKEITNICYEEKEEGEI